MTSSLTHLAIKYYADAWKFGLSESFPNLRSLSVEIRIKAHNPEHLKRASALEWKSLTELSVSVCQAHVGDLPTFCDATPDMTADDVSLFSKLSDLKQLSLGIGIDTPLLIALAGALPRALKHLDVRSFQIQDYRLESRTLELNADDFNHITSLVPQGLEVLSLPIAKELQVTCITLQVCMEGRLVFIFRFSTIRVGWSKPNGWVGAKMSNAN